MFITSKAITMHHDGDKIIACNEITGRCFTFLPLVEELLYFCKSARTEEEIIDFLSPQIPKSSTKRLIRILTMNNILVNNEKMIFVNTIPAHPALWGSNRKICPQTKIIIIGVPFGYGNAVDIRCKDFPHHFRNYIWRHFSHSPPLDNIDSMDVDEMGQYFDYENFKEHIKGCRIADIGDVAFYSGENSGMLYFRLQEISRRVFQNGQIPIIVGGDHSITYPIITALNGVGMAFDIVHFDAHADMKDGKVMRLHEHMSEIIVNHANVIRRILDYSNVYHVFQIGVREPNKYEHEKITMISVEDVKRGKYMSEMEQSALPVYITFDIDYFDPSLVPGTANKLFKGGDKESTFAFLKKMLYGRQIIGIDIVEANPALDINNRTTLLVNNLLMQLISIIKV